MNFSLLPSKNPSRLSLRSIDRTLIDTSAGAQLRAQRRARRNLTIAVAGSFLAAFVAMGLINYFVK